MKRTLSSQTIKSIEKKVKVSGWIQSVRLHGKIVFVDLRDRGGIMQIVFTPKNKDVYDLAQTLKNEWVISVEGIVKKRPEKMINPEIKSGTVELSGEKIEILSKSETPPFELKSLNLSLTNLLDHRPLTLRNKTIKAIFKIKEEMINGFRESLKEMDFSEFQSPVIVPTSTEGGAEIFNLQYFGYNAYLAQSPQFYKQIMVGVNERAFTISHVCRAEPSMTTRHMAEYISLDAEMGFIDSWDDIMVVCEKTIRHIFKKIEKECSEELKLFEEKLPEFNSEFPRIKMREAQEIIFKRTGRDNREKSDLEPQDEKDICEWAKEKHNSDFVFITHYPTSKRPFYSYKDPEDPEYTLSFDLLYKGLEIVTGGRRISDYKELVESIKKQGNNPKDFSFYLQTFKYGMPPGGGFAIGSERLVKQTLGLSSVKEASLFPRDMIRIDQRLSVLHPKKKKNKK